MLQDDSFNKNTVIISKSIGLFQDFFRFKILEPRFSKNA